MIHKIVGPENQVTFDKKGQLRTMCGLDTSKFPEDQSDGWVYWVSSWDSKYRSVNCPECLKFKGLDEVKDGPS
jgi:phage terminase large subunit-like protein